MLKEYVYTDRTGVVIVTSKLKLEYHSFKSPEINAEGQGIRF